jgi:hypothetical protein
MSSAPVDGNGQNPGLQGPDSIPLVQMAHSPHQCFLGHVFRILSVTELSHAKSEHFTLVLLDKRLQTIAITSQAAFDEFPVVHRALHLSLERNTCRSARRFQYSSRRAIPAGNRLEDTASDNSSAARTPRPAISTRQFDT